MKKILVLLSVLAVLTACLVGCGCNNDGAEVKLDIEYELTEDNTGYKVVGISSNVADTPISEVVIPSEYNGLDVVEIESVSNARDFLGKLTLPSTIKVIRENAFSGCASLTEINIPSSVVSVERGAFENCSSLREIVLPSSVTVINENVFNGCKELCEFSIHPDITEIKSYAFANSGIKEIVIPDTVTVLGEGIFHSCLSLKEATLPNHLTYIPASTFAKCTALKSVHYNEAIVTKLEMASFLGCNILVDLNFDNLLKIEKDALLGCTLLTEKYDGIYYSGNWIVGIDKEQVVDKIVIADNVIGISDGALDGGFMVELVIPDSVVFAGDEALCNLSSLKSIQIGKGLNNIGALFLYNCPSLESIIVSEENTAIKAIDNCLYSLDEKTLIKYCTGSKQESFTVPSTVEAIGKYAFAYSGLKEIILPNRLLSIMTGSFENCNKLSKISLPSSLMALQENAFYNCSLLEEISIPVGITEIAYSLFVQCTSLKNVTLNGNITKIDSYAFEGCSSLENIIFPQSLVFIGIGSFRDCISLKDIYIPKNVESIDEYAFMNTKSLSEITVDTENARYTSFDGVLYTKDMKKLVQYPVARQASSFTLPDSVAVICAGAFAKNATLNEIKLSNSLEIIEAKAFSYCTEVKEIHIPASVKAVYANAFEYSGFERIIVDNKKPSYDENGWSPYWNIYTDALITWNN